jgi:hypothetical protein
MTTVRVSSTSLSGVREYDGHWCRKWKSMDTVNRGSSLGTYHLAP